jgi:hypothetical protein
MDRLKPVPFKIRANHCEDMGGAVRVVKTA